MHGQMVGPWEAACIPVKEIKSLVPACHEPGRFLTVFLPTLASLDRYLFEGVRSGYVSPRYVEGSGHGQAPWAKPASCACAGLRNPRCAKKGRAGHPRKAVAFNTTVRTHVEFKPFSTGAFRRIIDLAWASANELAKEVSVSPSIS